MTQAGTVAGTRAGAASGSVPLPQDLLTIGKGAVYLARAGQFEFSSGNQISKWFNAADPGTHDLVVEGGPGALWVPGGGIDGKGCVRFDGSTEYLTVTDFTWSSGGRPSMYLVNRLLNVTNVPDCRMTSLQQVSFVAAIAMQQRMNTFSTNDKFLATTYVGGGVTLEYGTPEADGAPASEHLHEFHAYSSALTRLYDGDPGTAVDPGALGNNLFRFVVGAYYNGSAFVNFANQEVSEIVLSDAAAGSSEADAYRSQRVAVEYPSIPLV